LPEVGLLKALSFRFCEGEELLPEELLELFLNPPIWLNLGVDPFVIEPLGVC